MAFFIISIIIILIQIAINLGSNSQVKEQIVNDQITQTESKPQISNFPQPSSKPAQSMANSQNLASIQTTSYSQSIESDPSPVAQTTTTTNYLETCPPGQICEVPTSNPPLNPSPSPSPNGYPIVGWASYVGVFNGSVKDLPPAKPWQPGDPVYVVPQGTLCEDCQ